MEYGGISSMVSGKRMILSVKRNADVIKVYVDSEDGNFGVTLYLELLDRLKDALAENSGLSASSIKQKKVPNN